ncbi:hypothetical protein [Achromobacter animicus]|uniref:hypothetical protein n=1 Tax=Achromobacter animicus TaxID=1389935 RepID=UPI0028A77B92|nr:hypothetical protein [Achromobacter animicus]
MLVSELLGQHPSVGLLMQCPLWGRRVETLTTNDLRAFLQLHVATARHFTAKRQVEVLMKTMWEAVTDGRLTAIPKACYFAVPEVRVTLGEIRAWLEQTTPARRAALVFGMECELTCEQVIELTWRDYLEMDSLTDLAVSVAEQFPRHFRLPYVFWEVSHGGYAQPMLGLRQTVLDITNGQEYEELARLYDRAIPIDSEADLGDFLLHHKGGRWDSPTRAVPILELALPIISCP